MKTRNTLLLLLLAGGLFFAVEFYDMSHLGTREREERSTQILPGFDRSGINAIDLQRPDGPLAFKKVEDAWMLDVPVRDRADMSAISRLLTALETLTLKARISDPSKEQLASFGLGKPALRVSFEGKDAPPELVLGEDAAVGTAGGFYARVGQSGDVFLVDGDLKQQVKQASTDFRDRRLLADRVADADRMIIHRGDGDIEVTRENEDWSMTKPLKARADAQKIRDLIASMTNAQITEFEVENAKADTGLAEPSGTVDLFFNGADTPETVKFGRSPADKPDQVFLTVSSRMGVVTVPKGVANALGKKPNDLRDRHLVRINPDIIDRVAIAQAGHPLIQLGRKQEEWEMLQPDQRPANGARINEVIDDLRNHEVLDFTADSGAELEKYGLAQPVLTLSFSSFASENTAESKAGENEITSIAFGKTAEGVFAKVADEPFVVKLDPALFEEVSGSPSSWHSLAVTNLEPSSFSTLTLSPKGHPAVGFNREKDTWKAESGAVDVAAVASLANTMAKLRAVRWIGDTSPESGLQDPDFTVEATSANGTTTLLVGNSTPEKMHFAQLKGESGIFLMSNPDFLTISNLVSKEAPSEEAAAPGPSPSVLE